MLLVGWLGVVYLGLGSEVYRDLELGCSGGYPPTHRVYLSVQGLGYFEMVGAEWSGLGLTALAAAELIKLAVTVTVAVTGVMLIDKYMYIHAMTQSKLDVLDGCIEIGVVGCVLCGYELPRVLDECARLVVLFEDHLSLLDIFVE